MVKAGAGRKKGHVMKAATELNLTTAMRYSRQIMLPSFELQGQEKLLAAKVLVIGVGGLGCAALPYLASSGVGQLTLVDGDVIDRSNLQRQILFRESDIGKNKAEVAAAALAQLNSDVKLGVVSSFADEILLAELIAQHDLVLDCCDNLSSRLLINQYCYQLQVPLVSGAAIRMEGQVSSFAMNRQQQPDVPCYQCLSLGFAEQQLSCLEAGILSPVVGVIGTMQALEAIKILSGCGSALYGCLLLLDGKYSEWQSFNIRKEPHCPCCGTSAVDKQPAE
jgi:adenylyltransferase/sulfurtransferase